MALTEKRKTYLRKWYQSNIVKLRDKKAEWQRRWRKENPVLAKETDKKKRRKYEKRRNAYSSTYYKNHKQDKLFKEKRNHRSLQYYYLNKEKAKARSLANRKLGKQKVGKCEMCGKKEKLQKHHKDYNQPLLVKMICRICHKKEHKALADLHEAVVRHGSPQVRK